MLVSTYYEGAYIYTLFALSTHQSVATVSLHNSSSLYLWKLDNPWCGHTYPIGCTGHTHAYLLPGTTVHTYIYLPLLINLAQ